MKPKSGEKKHQRQEVHGPDLRGEVEACPLQLVMYEGYMGGFPKIGDRKFSTPNSRIL